MASGVVANLEQEECSEDLSEPSRNRLCILALKYDIWWQEFVHFFASLLGVMLCITVPPCPNII